MWYKCLIVMHFSDYNDEEDTVGQSQIKKHACTTTTYEHCSLSNSQRLKNSVTFLHYFSHFNQLCSDQLNIH